MPTPPADRSLPTDAGNTTGAGSADELRAARTVARLSKLLELSLLDADLTLPQYRALVFLEHGKVAPSALAGLLTVSRPTITALIDGLVARDLVERRADPVDRRRVEHRLTAAGIDALAAADEAVAQRLTNLLSHVSPGDRRVALDGAAVWGTAIDRARDAAIERA